MFEVGFAELFLLGVIALLVVGPDRLPGLARTVGVWVGKAQRLVGQVRADIEREVRADELRKAAKEYSPTAVLSDVRKEVEDFTSDLSRPADLDAGADETGEPAAGDARADGRAATAATGSEGGVRKAADTPGADEPGSTGPAAGDASEPEAPAGPSGDPAGDTAHAAEPETDAGRAPSPPGSRRVELPAVAAPGSAAPRSGEGQEGGESASASDPEPDAAKPAEGTEGRTENAAPPTVMEGAGPPRVERDERTSAP